MLSEVLPPSPQQQRSPSKEAWNEPFHSLLGANAALGGSRLRPPSQSEALNPEQRHLPSMPGAKTENRPELPRSPQEGLRTPSPAALQPAPLMPPSPVPSSVGSTPLDDWQQREHSWTATNTMAMLWLAGGLLAASVLLNCVMYQNSPGAALGVVSFEPWQDGPQTRGTREQLLDSDGDGVPDHHDWCPQKKRTSRKADGRESGWISGRASDFDGDGCEDGVEDEDKDNDGIEDKIDRCPMSPMQYRFVSNAVSDFDGDGCADGVEDLDDDGDGVSNSIDECRQTDLGDSSDSEGCSAKQRTARDSAAEGQLPSEHPSPEVTSVSSETPSVAGVSDEASVTDTRAGPNGDAWTLSGWTATTKSIRLEVLLAAGLMLVLHFLKAVLRAVKVEAGISLMLQRCLLYAGFFGVIYTVNVFWISKSAMTNSQQTS